MDRLQHYCGHSALDNAVSPPADGQETLLQQLLLILSPPPSILRRFLITNNYLYHLSISEQVVENNNHW